MGSNEKASVTKELNERHRKILEGLLKLPENRECADCKSKQNGTYRYTGAFSVEILEVFLLVAGSPTCEGYAICPIPNKFDLVTCI